MTRPEQSTSPEPGRLTGGRAPSSSPQAPAVAADPSVGPVAVFAKELRALRRRAGSPPYRAMGVTSGLLASSLTRAATGRTFPTWTVTQGFVQACGGDLVEWEARWRRAAQAIHGTAVVAPAWEPVDAERAEPPKPASVRLGDFLRPRRLVPLSVPDPDDAVGYDELRTALRRRKESTGFSYDDLQRNTEGRLSRHHAAAILDGVLPATREQFVLLLKALGLRDDLERWVSAWSRFDGPNLGAAHADPTSPPSRLAPLVLAVVLVAVAVAVLLLLV